MVFGKSSYFDVKILLLLWSLSALFGHPDMEQLTPDQLKESLQMHLSELESLESVFCNPGELKIEDIYTLADIRDYVNNKTNIPPSYLDLTINIVVDGLKFEFCVAFPHGYPKHKDPEIFVRNHELNRNQHIKLNKDIWDFLASQEKGEPSIFSVISFMKDKAHEYAQVEPEQPLQKDEKDEKFVRYWIYSHHIYSRTKRREILEVAEQLKITGFCMPGKPGIICIEGTSSDVSEWWHYIKSLNWKKIICKVVEDDKDQEGRNFLKFDKFEETVFQNSGIKCNHMDMGELHRFLEEHSVGYIFKDIFGVETKPST